MTPSHPPPPNKAQSSAALAAVAIGMLVVGLVFGFFIGRASEDSDESSAAPSPTTSPTTRPTGGTIPPTPPTTGNPSAPPSTDLEPQVIGTIEDPIALGEPYVLGVFEVTVHAADLDAADALAEHDPANPPAPEGYNRVVVEVTIRFTESDGFTDTSYLPFDVRNGDGTWTDLDAGCGKVPESILSGVLLGPDESATGNLCFTVPIDRVDNLHLTTEGFDGPVYFALS